MARKYVPAGGWNRHYASAVPAPGRYCQPHGRLMCDACRAADDMRRPARDGDVTPAGRRRLTWRQSDDVRSFHFAHAPEGMWTIEQRSVIGRGSRYYVTLDLAGAARGGAEVRLGKFDG